MPSPRPPAQGPPRRQRTTTTATARRQRVAELLLDGADTPTIARLLNCSVRTAERDVQAVQPLVQDLRRQRLQRISDQLGTAATAAVTALSQTIADPDTPPAVRVRAAQVLLAEVRAFTDVTDLAARLAAVEERLADAGRADTGAPPADGLPPPTPGDGWPWPAV